ncbi:TPA: hypothetical protein JBL33_13880 [Legionella pneumophila]|nr:hypothetical protein [Legionella pneumophila subsp. pneumophila]HAU2022395.1 hypothetical protein [Legionella pneumophila]HAU2439030.1 hypothetical protein [Legionella pneumophila]
MKKIFVLFLLLPMTLNAAHLFENLELAKKCHKLAIFIDELAAAEQVSFCKNKVHSASTYTEMAANDFMFDGSNSAKLKLELAIRDMAYSAVEDCTKASDIALTKNELQKIHDVIP